MPDDVPAVKYPRTPGYRPEARGKQVQRLVLQDDDEGRAERQARRQDGRAQGQRLPRRRADDERRLDARRLCAGHRRDDRHPHSRRRRHDRRQDALRIFLLLRRQPHQRDRARSTIRTRWAIRPAARLRAAASLVAAGEVDMAIGGDQGGSIRMPASFCGIYGMKPTHGLVPYTGVMPIEITLDHTGPMTATVARQCAAAGGARGRRRPRSRANTRPRSRTIRRRSAGGVKGLRDRHRQGRFRPCPNSRAGDVDAKVRGGAELLRQARARPSRRSRSPMHLLGRRHLDADRRRRR